MTYAEKTIFNYASSCGDKRYVYRMWLIFRKNNQTTKNDSAEKSSDINSSSNAVTEAVQNNTDNENILIAYFSVPENGDTDGIDANSGASIVVKIRTYLEICSIWR